MRPLTAKEENLFRTVFWDKISDSSKLYKYYNTDEEERCSIPDIWDMLNDERDKLLDEYDKQRLAYAKMTPNDGTLFYPEWNIRNLKNDIARYDDFISKVKHSDAEYFMFDGYDLTEVRETELCVHKLKLKDGKFTFEITDDTATVWTLASTEYNKTRIRG